MIGGALEPSRRHLFKVQFHFQQARLLHPKLSKLLTTVGQWLQNHPKEGGQARVLLLLNRYPDQLYKEISEALTTLPLLRVGLYSPDRGADILGFLRNHDVAVVTLSTITPEFSWKAFDYVIEYEYRCGVTREDLYAGNSRLKQHLALRSYNKHVDTTQLIQAKGQC